MEGSARGHGWWLPSAGCLVATLAGSPQVPCGFSTQVVREQLLCHAIVGSEGRKTKIMQVALSCQFVAPALQMSSRALTFRVEKVSLQLLTGSCGLGMLGFRGGGERAAPSPQGFACGLQQDQAFAISSEIIAGCSQEQPQQLCSAFRRPLEE